MVKPEPKNRKNGYRWKAHVRLNPGLPYPTLCGGWATITENGKTIFSAVFQQYCKTEKQFFWLFFWIYGKTRSGKWEIWIPLESLCQALSGGTCPNSVGALVELQNGKTVFPVSWPNRIQKMGNMGSVGILISSPIQGYLSQLRRCLGWAKIMQNGKSVFFSFFPDLLPNRIRKMGNMGTAGILMSSPNRGYLSQLRRCPNWANNAKLENHFFTFFPD